MVKKKNIRKSALLLIMIMLATGITACGTEEEPLPDLSAMGAVTAVSREEGSGTRAEFENLLKLPESDTGIVVDSTEKSSEKGGRRYSVSSEMADRYLPGLLYGDGRGCDCPGGIFKWNSVSDCPRNF